MSLLLNIDTALDTASVCLAKDDEVLQLSFNKDQKDHASWLHHTIAELLQKADHTIKDLDAIAVSIGPGSYTGLRVGLATAKGFCYALQIPLIAVNTLKLLAFAVKDEAPGLICPLIDARRMEIFAAVFDKNMNEKVAPHSMIVDENSFSTLLASHKVLFCGTGAKKSQPIIPAKNAAFSNTMADASHLALLSFPFFTSKRFADLAYSEPFYLKEFYTTACKS